MKILKNLTIFKNEAQGKGHLFSGTKLPPPTFAFPLHTAS